MGYLKDESQFEQLCKAFLTLKTLDECKRFMRDVCTKTEITSMSQRLETAFLLLNHSTYTEIEKMTQMSSTTISRINRCIASENQGGYHLVYQRLQEHSDEKLNSDEK